MAYDIRIDKFEGPLDLLLHLIKKNEMDICDIRISEITAQYVAFLDEMKSLNLDIAGEYLVMAATLLQIKSQMLLPQPEEELAEEEEGDPRAELIKRLLEYQRYKDAALNFDRLPQLERDVFLHAGDVNEVQGEGEEFNDLEPVGLFELVEVFRGLLRSAPAEMVHEITTEQLSITEKIHTILAELQEKGHLAFAALYNPDTTRREMVVFFLAMLELVKMKLVKIYQNQRHGEIWLSLSVTQLETDEIPLEDPLEYN